MGAAFWNTRRWYRKAVTEVHKVWQQVRTFAPDALKQDCILHGGDINNQGVLDTLEQIAPVYVVRGNNDKEWAEHLTHDLTVQLEDLKIFMVHNKKEIQNLPLDADIVVFGHSHKYFEQVVDGKLWLNPGSCGKRRFGQEISFAVLTIDGENYWVQKIVLPQA